LNKFRYNKTAEEEYANPTDNLGFFANKILKVLALNDKVAEQ
jgi:hypothetical protein